jgi:hypothetical protein
VPAVADLAVDLVVWALDAVEVVQLAATLDARKTLLVVQTALCVHLFSLKDLKKEFKFANIFYATEITARLAYCLHESKSIIRRE